MGSLNAKEDFAATRTPSPAECPALTQPLSARGSGPFSDVELKTKSGSLIVSVPTVAYRRPKRSR